MFNNKRILTLEAESKELRAHIIEMRNQIEGILSALAETQKSFKDCSLVVSSEFPLIKKEITLLESNFTERLHRFSNAIDETRSRIIEDMVEVKKSISEVQERIFKAETNIDNTVTAHDLEIDKKFVSFHQEITDKYFNAIEQMYKFSKEISLIDSLAKNTKDGDFLRLKTELTRPVLEAKWKKAELEKGKQADENIKTLGQDIVAMRKQIHDEMLIKERQGKDITELKGKMEILNLIIGDEL